MRAAGFLALVAAFAVAAWLGWWTVPALGFLWGIIGPRPPDRPTTRPAVAAALAALLGWAFWLGVDLGLGQGGLGRLGPRVAGALQVPFPVLLLVTLLLPALLAGSAALVGNILAGFLPRTRRAPG